MDPIFVIRSPGCRRRVSCMSACGDITSASSCLWLLLTMSRGPKAFRGERGSHAHRAGGRWTLQHCTDLRVQGCRLSSGVPEPAHLLFACVQTWFRLLDFMRETNPHMTQSLYIRCMKPTCYGCSGTTLQAWRAINIIRTQPSRFCLNIHTSVDTCFSQANAATRPYTK